MSEEIRRPFYSLADMKERNRRAGQCFFNADSMRFFRSRVSGTIYPVPTGAYFVTSERDESPYNSRSYPRLYTVRFMQLSGQTETVGEFQEYTSLKAAHRAAQTFADLDRQPHHIDYPHEPGRLHDCPACEDGPCVCDPETNAPCVSSECVQAGDD